MKRRRFLQLSAGTTATIALPALLLDPPLRSTAPEPVSPFLRPEEIAAETNTAFYSLQNGPVTVSWSEIMDPERW